MKRMLTDALNVDYNAVPIAKFGRVTYGRNVINGSVRQVLPLSDVSQCKWTWFLFAVCVTPLRPWLAKNRNLSTVLKRRSFIHVAGHVLAPCLVMLHDKQGSIKNKPVPPSLPSSPLPSSFSPRPSLKGGFVHYIKTMNLVKGASKTLLFDHSWA